MRLMKLFADTDSNILDVLIDIFMNPLHKLFKCDTHLFFDE